MMENIFEKRGRPPRESTTEFGKWLTEAMAERGMTATDLARIFNVSNSYISRVRSGFYIPTNVVACACACVFNEEYNYVLTLVDYDRYKKS